MKKKLQKKKPKESNAVQTYKVIEKRMAKFLKKHPDGVTLVKEIPPLKDILTNLEVEESCND